MDRAPSSIIISFYVQMNVGKEKMREGLLVLLKSILQNVQRKQGGKE